MENSPDSQPKRPRRRVAALKFPKGPSTYYVIIRGGRGGLANAYEVLRVGGGSANDYVIFFSAHHGRKEEKLRRRRENFFGVSFDSTFFRGFLEFVRQKYSLLQFLNFFWKSY